MSISSSRPAARRAAGLFSSVAVVAALLAATPAATAAPGAAAPAESATAVTPHFSNGRYIVLLREPAAASYGGSNARYAATRSTTGKFNARTAAVQSYTAHLRQTHETVAQAYDAEPVADLTVASNGFVADLTKQQAIELSSDSRVLLVEKSHNLKLDTWHTPEFLGLTGKNGAWTKHGGKNHAGAGVVVADLDSGIWPESKSFRGAPLNAKPQDQVGHLPHRHHHSDGEVRRQRLPRQVRDRRRLERR